MSEDEAEVVETETDSVDTAEVETGTDPVETDESDAGTDPVEAQPADEEPEDYRKALDKFGGDKGKFASEFWQAKNALSQAAKEKKQLEARLKELEGRTRQPEKPAAPPTPPEPHPDLKRIDERITTFTKKGEEIAKSQQQALIDLAKQDREIAKLEARVELADELEKPSWQARLDAAQMKRDGIVTKYQNDEERKELNQERLDRAQQEKDFASKHLESAKVRQEQVERERETFFEEFPQQIDGYIKDICDELKVSEDKDVREFLWSGAYAHLVNLLSPYHGQGIPADQVDFQGVLRQHIERSAKVFDVVGRAAIGKLSTAKRSVTKPAPTPVKAPPSNGTAEPTDWRDTPEMVARRQRLERLGI